MPQRVLVVDDEVSITELLATVLRYEGFDVETAITGVEALRRVASFRPDVVLLDVQLPDANGFDILNRIRSSGKMKNLPVLMLSGLGALEDIMKGLKLGANGYLTKPAKSRALLAAIEETIFR